MSKINVDKLSEKVIKFAQLRYIKVIMNAFMGIAAFSIGSSLFSLLKSIPIPAYQNFLTSSGLGDILSIPISIVSSLYAVMVVISVGYEVAKSYNQRPLPAAMVAFGAFMILTPFSGTVTIVNEAGETIKGVVANILPLDPLGSQGIFLAMICGIVGSRMYCFLLEKNVKIKMPDSLPPAVAGMFETMLPAGIIFILFMLLRVGFDYTSYGTMQSFIYTVLQAPLMGVAANPIGAFLYLFAGKTLWMFGIHGDMLVYATLGTIRTTASTANRAAFAAGTAIPYLEWGLLTVMSNVGILGLTILLLISKSKQYKSLGVLATPTSIFNITEPIMFGFPIIFNPIMAIPFILTPGISLLLTAGVMKLGLVAPILNVSLSNVIPVPIYLWMSTTSISGLIWGFVLIALNVVFYYPFFKIAERGACKEEQSMVEETA